MKLAFGQTFFGQVTTESPCYRQPLPTQWSGLGSASERSKRRRNAPELGRMMLDVADVDEVHLAAGDSVPGKAGWAFERFGGFGGDGRGHFLPADLHVGQRVVLFESDARDGFVTFVAAASCNSRSSNASLFGERYRSAKNSVWYTPQRNDSLPILSSRVLGRTRGDALVQHAQCCVILSDEKLSEVVEHGTSTLAFLTGFTGLTG